MIESKWCSWSRILNWFSGESLFASVQEADKPKNVQMNEVISDLQTKRRNIYLNWQNMSAYSAEIPVACNTVTRNVNSLPICKCSPVSSATSCNSDETLESPRPESASSISFSERDWIFFLLFFQNYWFKISNLTYLQVYWFHHFLLQYVPPYHFQMVGFSAALRLRRI